MSQSLSSLQRQLNQLQQEFNNLSNETKESGSFSKSSGSGGERYEPMQGNNKCMSTGGTACIVLVVILVVGVVIAGIVFTLQNRMPPEEIIIVNGGSGDSGGGVRPVSLSQHHRDTRLAQAQDAKRVSELQAHEVAERKRRDAAQAAMQKEHTHGGVRGGLPAMRIGGGSSPRPTAMAHRMAAHSTAQATAHSTAHSTAQATAQPTAPSQNRLMADAQTLPRSQPQRMPRQPAQANEPQASVYQPQSDMQTRMQARSAVGGSLSLMRKSNGTPSTRLATGGNNSGAGAGAGGSSHIANIRKSLAASNPPAHKASSNSNRFLAGVPGTTSYFAPGNATIIERARRIAQDLKDGRRCGPGGAGMPDAAIAAYAEDDAPPCL